MTALPREAAVAVVGGGIVGLCAALELAREGTEVVVLDDGARLGGTTANAGRLKLQKKFKRI